MKILINNSFKAQRTGEFVKANLESGEFILDTENPDDVVKATLVEIAQANKIEVGDNDTKGAMLNKLETGFENSNLPEQNEMSDSEVVSGIVAAGVAKGADDEDMIVQIIQAGIKYKVAAKMFMAAMTSGGHRISTKDRKEQANALLVEAEFSPENYDDVKIAVEAILKAISDTTEIQAVKLCRLYCKAYEIEFPKAEKAPRNSFKTKFQDFVCASPLCTFDEVKAWVLENKKDEKAAKRLWNSVIFAQKVAAATVALEA